MRARGKISVSKMDTRTFYDRISGAYDLIADASEGACREQGLNALDVGIGAHVLEIGFGTGHAIMSLAAAVGPAGRVYGVELSRGMLNVARNRALSVNSTNVAFAIDDARALCFPDAVFDAAFMSFTLELFDPADIPIVLAEVNRVLRPTGRLGVVGMAQTTHLNTMTEIYEWLHRHFPHFVDCRPIDIVGSLKLADFQVTRDATMFIWGLSVACAVGVKPLG
jgi:ubiquinone/menaquinone biosynthesis C-methylase UbiE